MKRADLAAGIVYILGAVAFALGVALIYPPAGLICAGAVAVASAVLYTRGSRE